MKNKTSGLVIAEELKEAKSFFKRLKGLMFTKELSSKSGMFIAPCSAVHTYFMNYTIDVLYLDKNNVILAVDEELKPRRIGNYVKNSVAVVELPGGRIKEMNIKVGQAVELI